MVSILFFLLPGGADRDAAGVDERVGEESDGQAHHAQGRVRQGGGDAVLGQRTAEFTG